ncbi:DUF2637 domain-containing protein [Kitasatospora sp. NPDC054939]
MARPSLTKAHRGLLGVVAAGAVLISGIGFAGSYNAVRDLAVEKGFGTFSYAFPIGVDAGIVVLLALDLVLTWLRIPFPLLRQTAWLLTAATIAFNAAASWGDALGMGMHAVIPVLFVVVIEASRHAVGRIADITADRHMESVRLMRWVLSPVPTFRLWRRMKLWELRSYEEVVRLEQNRLVYRAQLRFRYGRGWRRSAPIQALLPLKLAKFGVPLDPALLDRLDDEAGPARAAEEAREAQELPQGRTVAAAIPAAGQPQPQVQSPTPQPQGQQPVAQAAQPAPAPVAAEPQPAAAVPAVAPELAVPMLAKLAAVRLRTNQEPADAEEPVPAPPREELNVWTEKRARAGGEAPRVPGQASPWFKPPRPAGPEQAGPQQPDPQQTGSRPAGPGAPQAAGPRPAGPQQAEPRPVPAAQAASAAEQAYEPYPQEQLPDGPYPDGAGEEQYAGGPSAVHRDEPQSEGPAQSREPRAGAARLDPDLCFEALVAYIDTFDHQPDPQRLAAWLTNQYGMSGSLPDGSVHPKDVAELYPELRDRYVSAGRD